MTRPRGRLRRWLGSGLALIAIGAVIGWAGAAVFAPPRDALESATHTFVTLAEGEVGASITLNTVASWPQVPAGTNQASGTVTGVHVTPGDEVAVGTPLYEVDLRPTVIARGEVPAFRALSQGTKGGDVAQLQRMLTELGHYGGLADGEFGALTERAVRAWQRALDVEIDGVVRAGDLVFVPTLPGRVALDAESVFRGATLAGGEPVVSALAPEPTFTIPATSAQAAMMPVGTAVEISANGVTWQVSVAGQEPSGDGTDLVEVHLNGTEGAPVCGADCGSIPVVGQSLLTSRIVTQPTVTGVVAPSAALRTDADGTVSVVDETGTPHPVEVVASAQGMSVIEGAPAGLRVRVPAGAEKRT